MDIIMRLKRKRHAQKKVRYTGEYKCGFLKESRMYLGVGSLPKEEEQLIV